MSPSLALAQSRSPTRRDPLGRYQPVSLSRQTRSRFMGARRAELLRRLPGSEPDDRTRALIALLCDAGWALHEAQTMARRAKSAFEAAERDGNREAAERAEANWYRWARREDDLLGKARDLEKQFVLAAASLRHALAAPVHKSAGDAMDEFIANLPRRAE